MLLLIRVGFAISISPWLASLIKQQRPCYCSEGNTQYLLHQRKTINHWIDDGKTYNFYVAGWGMPAGITFTSTLIAMHFIESLSIPIGVLWIIIMWAASIASGMSLYMNILENNIIFRTIFLWPGNGWNCFGSCIPLLCYSKPHLCENHWFLYFSDCWFRYHLLGNGMRIYITKIFSSNSSCTERLSWNGLFFC